LLAFDAQPDAKFEDTRTTLIGVNRIGLNVRNLDQMLLFYESATGFEVVKHETVKDNPAADQVFGEPGVVYRTALLRAPNMLLELTEFSNVRQNAIRNMPPQGPGMTHTCFQSRTEDSGYDKFVRAGLDLLTRGEGPIDLGGYGVTYAYGYDPEGNMLEMEQLDEEVFRNQSPGEGQRSIAEQPMWMSQVAMATPDMERLVAYYAEVLGIPPNRGKSYADNPRFDAVADIDDLELSAAWFDLDGPFKMLELWEYHTPPTPPSQTIRRPTSAGYTFSLEVGDIEREYERLEKAGVSFYGKPAILGEFWIVFANDPDGNVYSLRQAVNPESVYSLRHRPGVNRD